MLDSSDMTSGCGCGAGPIANLRGGGFSFSPVGLDLQQTSEKGTGTAAQTGRMSRCAVHLHSLGREHNLGLRSFSRYGMVWYTRV